MRGKFLKLTRIIGSALKKKMTDEEIELATLKCQLIQREPDYEEEFKEAQSVDDLLTVVFKGCPLTDPDLLESFAVEFELPEVEEEVGKYRDDLKQYYNQVLAEDFVRESIEEYDKNTNITVSMHYIAELSHTSAFLNNLRMTQQSSFLATF